VTNKVIVKTSTEIAAKLKLENAPSVEIGLCPSLSSCKVQMFLKVVEIPRWQFTMTGLSNYTAFGR